ncbi:hypothetical protein [Marisediminicola antarctica]|uniref:Uncharacterized protein n=1 Tax=Marisediminicola antarctica TaxID=674079 RepID=A0A7L5AIG8_9MICO|nr:hypothetical protein [Marisediminicola antarctica]QHO69852.1 hypothetical protein BHD05_09570 [Marisediminicola antarctica]
MPSGSSHSFDVHPDSANRNSANRKAPLAVVTQTLVYRVAMVILVRVVRLLAAITRATDAALPQPEAPRTSSGGLHHPHCAAN